MTYIDFSVLDFPHFYAIVRIILLVLDVRITATVSATVGLKVPGASLGISTRVHVRPLSYWSLRVFSTSFLRLPLVRRCEDPRETRLDDRSLREDCKSPARVCSEPGCISVFLSLALVLSAGLRSYLTLPLVHKRFINNVWTVYLYGRAYARCVVLSTKWAVEGA